MTEEASNKRLLRYADDTEVKILVSYLTENTYNIVGKLPYEEMNLILNASRDYELSCARKSNKATQYLTELQDVFDSLPHSQRLAALVYLLGHTVYRLANLKPHHPENQQLIECIVKGDWLLPVFRLPALEPYLRNPDYLLLIFEAVYKNVEKHMDYELHLAIQEDFLQHTYQKLRQVYREYKQRVKEQTNIFKEELMMNVLHPDRIGPMIEKYGLEVMEWGI